MSQSPSPLPCIRQWIADTSTASPDELVAHLEANGFVIMPAAGLQELREQITKLGNSVLASHGKATQEPPA